eukprot:105979-Amphidinium_carterae.1
MQAPKRLRLIGKQTVRDSSLGGQHAGLGTDVSIASSSTTVAQDDSNLIPDPVTDSNMSCDCDSDVDDPAIDANMSCDCDSDVEHPATDANISCDCDSDVEDPATDANISCDCKSDVEDPATDSHNSCHADGDAWVADEQHSSKSSSRSPSCLEEVLTMLERLLRDVVAYDKQHGTEYIKRIESKFTGGIVVTTTYSGCGGGETAMKMAEVALQRVSACKTKVALYSACDNGKLQQGVLLGMGTMHVFGDVLDRLRAEIRTALYGVLNKYIEKFETKKAECVSGQLELRELKNRLGLACLDELSSIVDCIDFEHWQANGAAANPMQAASSNDIELELVDDDSMEIGASAEMPVEDPPEPATKGKGKGSKGKGRGAGRKRGDGSEKGTKSDRQCQGCMKWFPADLFPPGSIYCGEDKKARDALYRAAVGEGEVTWFNEQMQDPSARRRLFAEYHLRCPAPAGGGRKPKFSILRYSDRWGKNKQSESFWDA